MINCTNKSSASQYKNIFEKVLTEGFFSYFANDYTRSKLFIVGKVA